MSTTHLAVVSHLEALATQLEELTLLTRQEAELLANARIEDLQRVLARKAQLIEHANQARERCREVFAAALGVTLTSHARLATLVEDVGLSWADQGARAQQEELSEVWQRIVITLDDLERAQLMSERLARQGVRWIEGCLEQMSEPGSSQKSNATYDRQGRSRTQASSFLRRQA